MLSKLYKYIGNLTTTLEELLSVAYVGSPGESACHVRACVCVCVGEGGELKYPLVCHATM